MKKTELQKSHEFIDKIAKDRPDDGKHLVATTIHYARLSKLGGVPRVEAYYAIKHISSWHSGKELQKRTTLFERMILTAITLLEIKVAEMSDSEVDKEIKRLDSFHIESKPTAGAGLDISPIDGKETLILVNG